MHEFDDTESFFDFYAFHQNEIHKSDPNCVQILTMHCAKGLEFDVVFLPGWVQNEMPSIKCIKEGLLEEERRLAFVGLTRAKNRVIISCFVDAQSQPSQFIRECSV